MGELLSKGDVTPPKFTRNNLSPEVRTHADGLFAQLAGVFTPAGIQTSADLDLAVKEGRLKPDQRVRAHKLVAQLSQVFDTGEIPLRDEATIKENKAWEKLLGVKVEVPPLPDWVTPEVKTRLEGLGFGHLVCIPTLDLHLDDLRQPIIITRQNPNTGQNEDVDVTVESFLEKLHREYPNWRPYETLTDKQKADHSVVRNLEKWYWEQVKAGKIDFPSLPGKWLAVENVEKPNYGTKYADTPLATKMGFEEDRFNHSWNDVTAAQQRVEAELLSEIDAGSIGIQRNDKAKLVKPTALEYNLLANRFGWGKTDTYEHVEDEYRGSGGSGRLIVGYSGHGGAAIVDYWRLADPNGYVGFRFAVELKP